MNCSKCSKSFSDLDNRGSKLEPICPNCLKNNDSSSLEEEYGYRNKICDEITNDIESKEIQLNKKVRELDKGEPLITAKTYLNYPEARHLRDFLISIGIFAQIEQSGNNGDDDPFYRIDIQKTDAEKAIDPINDCINKMVEKTRKDVYKNAKCPKCGSRAFSKAIMLSIIERILFIGCEAMQCEKCGKKWVI